ncbi:MAG: L-aspartate oxidase [Gammaproteobacteria bacterium]|nr:L-aspartate oxidase [Gammaproteobacteria bacterium]
MITLSPERTVLKENDIIIVGGGLAGLGTALRLAVHRQVTLVAKTALTEGSSLYAQGGIAAVQDTRDSFDSHVQDTLLAGAGLCHVDTVEQVVRRGPEAIRWLSELGVVFDPAEDAAGSSRYHLTREGGHSHRRVVHAHDTTGQVVTTTLEQLVRDHPRIRILENHLAIDLITSRKLHPAAPNRCVGLYALDESRNRVVTLAANAVVLATGGASKVYLYTSNPDTATGDGIAIAWRAGCRVANMEFVQFHPTCLYHPQAKSFLISEALRGEGARLLLPDGEAFMIRHHPEAELAPRDVVARAIDFEMKKGGYDHVYLDISHRDAAFIQEHFPNISRRVKTFGFDLTTGPIPVVPAAHYTCGGIAIDAHGRTDLPGLYALGEVSFTGLHGANRLASNSLLECLVYGEAVAEDILARTPISDALPPLPAWDESRVTDADEQIVVSHNWDELRRAMWDYVGIVRTDKRLKRARRRIDLLHEEIAEYYRNFRVTSDLLELRNLVLVAELTVRCAQARKESRGLHFTRNYPQTDPDLAHDTLLVPPEPTFESDLVGGEAAGSN